MKRISIIGNSAAGKSTLAKTLGKALSLEVFTIDKIYWKANWSLRDQASYGKLHGEWLEKDSWIIDGVGYWAELESRLQKSDVIVFLDVSVSQCKENALRRIESEKYSTNTDIAVGCVYSAVEELQMQAIESFHHETRPMLLDLLSEISPEKVKIVQSAALLHLSAKN